MKQSIKTLSFALLLGTTILITPIQTIASPIPLPPTELEWSAQKGDIERVKRLLKSGTKVDERQEDCGDFGCYYRGTPLVYAIRGNQPEMVRFLVENGADVNISDHLPLITAIEVGNLDIIKYLMENGAESYNVESALILAAGSDDLEMLKYFYQKNKEINQINNDGYMAALISAIDAEKTQNVLFLLEHGVDINKDKNGDTALTHAVYTGNLKMIKLLVEKGVYISRENIIYYSQMFGKNSEGISFLIEHAYDKDDSILLYAATLPEPDTLARLIEKGVEVNGLYDDERYSLLMKAVESGRVKNITYLLEHGADVNLKSVYGDTALMSAVQNANPEIITLLLDNGADINARRGSVRQTALMFAARDAYPETVALLLDNGADINAQDADKKTALIYAKEAEDEDIVKLLVERGAITEVDLIQAVKAGNMKATKILLEQELLNEGKTGNIQRALAPAASNGDIDMLTFLLDNGADINGYVDRYFNTALSYAIVFSDMKTIRFLVDKGASANVGRGRLWAQQIGDTEKIKFLDDGTHNINAKEFALAAYAGDMEKIKFLLDKGIDINAQYDWHNAFFWAALGGQNQTYLFLLNESKKYDTDKTDDLTRAVNDRLVIAFMHGTAEEMEQSLKSGANPNIGSPHMSILERAVLEGKTDKVAKLLEYGADISRKNKEGKTPLDVALQKDKDSELVSLLMRYQTQNNKQNTDDIKNSTSKNPKNTIYPDKGGNTELMYAVRDGSVEEVKTLLENAADANMPNKNGFTPLMQAAMDKNREKMALLLSHGADVNAQDNEGWSAWHYLWNTGTLFKLEDEIIALLIGNGVDINIKNKQGETADFDEDRIKFFKPPTKDILDIIHY